MSLIHASNSSQGASALAATLPRCAVRKPSFPLMIIALELARPSTDIWFVKIACIASAMSNGTCTPGDLVCTCTSSAYQAQVGGCLAKTCSIRELLCELIQEHWRGPGFLCDGLECLCFSTTSDPKHLVDNVWRQSRTQRQVRRCPHWIHNPHRPCLHPPPCFED